MTTPRFEDETRSNLPDFVLAAVVMALAFAIAAWVWGYTLNMEDAVHAYILWTVGFAYLALFIILNFWLERLWFPRPRPGMTGIPPLSGARRRAHMALGSVEALLFILAILLIGSGTSIMGTRGYGSF